MPDFTPLPQPLPSTLLAIQVTERINSCISILGIVFILFTYNFYPTFRKPINRLIFFASWGNLGLNIATLINIDSFGKVALCKTQGFMVQMFLGVDVWWALCMAINVYLAFFRGRSISELQALEVRYLFACYGLSFIPAFIFIFFDIYGQSGIWCSISDNVRWLRLVALYGIVWVALIFSLVVYILAGREIWRKRALLDGFINPWNESPFAGTVTTEIVVTNEARDDSSNTKAESSPYTINIESAAPKKASTGINVRTITRDVANNEMNAESWLYARAAFLFFIALAITWVPASIFRIYDVAHPEDASFALQYLASFLFPLQGFWNAVVYILTSRTACKEFWDSIRGRKGSISDASIRNGQLGTSYRRGKSASFQTDQEELNPKMLSVHDMSKRSSACEHSEIIELPSYRP